MTDEELEKETMKRLSEIRQKKYRCCDICSTWNSEDRDCEVYGINHPAPFWCPLFFQKTKGDVRKENKMTEKEKRVIKEIVTENFSCSYCKELGLFDGCNAKKKSCKQIVSEWFDKVMEQEK